LTAITNTTRHMILKMIRFINQTIVFFLEMGMLISVTYFGYRLGDILWVQIFLALVFPLFTIVIWANWLAPKSTSRLKMPYLAVVRLLLFLIAAYSLYLSNMIQLALIMAVLSIITQTVSLFTEGSAIPK